jgi:DNA-binding response OmpR family regulator
MSAPHTLLVVSCEPAVVHGLQDILGRDYRVLTATCARDALTTLEDQEVQVVLTDHRLPEMTGIAFLRQVRGDRPQVVRLLFCGQADSWAANEAVRHGGLFRFLSEPWDADELLPVIRQALEQYDQQLLSSLGPATVRPLHHPPKKSLPVLQEGSKLGQYQLLERVGQGGMGVVYKARHILLKRVVALKVLPAELLTDATAIARFRREMKAVGRLQHPNIVQASDARMVRGVPFLVMEFVEGLDLARLVARFGPLPVAEACALIRQAALGLQHAYEHGLVHRDLKPASLMLTPAGQVKVLDLGLARLLDDLPAAAEQEQADNVVGTVDYMAPEQCRTPHAVDTRADVYSLGCTLYELLAGRPPFSGPGFETVALKLLGHASAAMPSIRRLRPEVPKGLATVLRKLLAKSPARRCRTPADVAAALEPFAGGADLPALLTSQRQTPPDRRDSAGMPTEEYRPARE